MGITGNAVILCIFVCMREREMDALLIIFEMRNVLGILRVHSKVVPFVHDFSKPTKPIATLHTSLPCYCWPSVIYRGTTRNSLDVKLL